MRKKIAITFFLIFLILSQITFAQKNSIFEFRLACKENAQNCQRTKSPNLKEELWIANDTVLSDSDIQSVELKIVKTPATIDDMVNYLKTENKNSTKFQDEPRLLIKFTEDGKKKLKGITAKNLKRRLAIFFKGTFTQAPVIIEPINSGELEIICFAAIEETQKMVDEFNKSQGK